MTDRTVGIVKTKNDRTCTAPFHVSRCLVGHSSVTQSRYSKHTLLYPDTVHRPRPRTMTIKHTESSNAIPQRTTRWGVRTHAHKRTRTPSHIRQPSYQRSVVACLRSGSQAAVSNQSALCRYIIYVNGGADLCSVDGYQRARRYKGQNVQVI